MDINTSKVLDLESTGDVFKGDDMKRPLICLRARHARQVLRAPVHSLVARDCEVHKAVGEVDNSERHSAAWALALDVVVVVHVDVLAIRTCQRVIISYSGQSSLA